MKINFKLIVGVLAISLVAFASCKKKKDDNSVKSRIVGKWKATQVGEDANNNSIMEASEVMAVTDSFGSSITFNADGNGNVAADFLGTSFSIAFAWNLLNNDADLHLKPTTTGAGEEETTVHIQSLTATDLVIKDTATNGGVLVTSWAIYKKQ